MTFGDQLWAVCLQRTIEQGPFLPEEIGQLRHLPQHLSAAGVLAQAMGYARADAALAAFEASHRPVMLLNKEGMVIRCNQSAEKLLGPDLQLSGGRLLSSSAQATSKLHKSIRDLIWSLEPMRSSAIVSLPRHETRPLLAYLTAPGEGIFDILGACHCIITLIDPNEMSIAEPSMLKEYFGLSPAEARIAADVAMGKMLPDVCATLHISYETGRSHLKNVFSKLGVHGQGELAALITSLAERSPIEAGKGTSAPMG
jgi:DNA-binding CsgD family transcriptional regulator